MEIDSRKILLYEKLIITNHYSLVYHIDYTGHMFIMFILIYICITYSLSLLLSPLPLFFLPLSTLPPHSSNTPCNTSWLICGNISLITSICCYIILLYCYVVMLLLYVCCFCCLLWLTSVVSLLPLSPSPSLPLPNF